MNKILIVGLCLVLVVTFSGCLNLNSNHQPTPFWIRVSSLDVNGLANATDIEKLNFSDVKTKIETLTYNITYYANNTTVEKNYIFRNDSTTNATGYTIIGSEDLVSFYHLRNEAIGHFSVMEQMVVGDSEEEAIQKETDKIQKYAKICNVQIDWSTAKWHIYYHDTWD